MSSNRRFKALVLLISFSLFLFIFSLGQREDRSIFSEASAATAEKKDDVELSLPKGFRAELIHPGLGTATRHIAVTPKEKLYAIRKANAGGGVYVLDLKNLEKEPRKVSDIGGTGMEYFQGFIYFSSDYEVFRFELDPESDLPKSGRPQRVVSGFPNQSGHAAKSLAISAEGELFVNSGAPSNACQEKPRTRGSRGLRPCPQLERSGGVWKFSSKALEQDQIEKGARYVTGLRHAVALAWNPLVKKLFLVQHGRDQLHTLFPELYDVEANAELPAEEFHLVAQGANLGWPYTYFDPLEGKRVVAPEYGGDGAQEPEGDKFQDPLIGFPAHWAPNDLLFYTGSQFPPEYHGAALIAFHGSWNRAPLEQQGFKVVAVPMKGAKPLGEYKTFAKGFAGQLPISSPSQAKYRPMGLAQGPSGELYISDSVKGRVWKIRYQASVK